MTLYIETGRKQQEPAPARGKVRSLTSRKPRERFLTRELPHSSCIITCCHRVTDAMCQLLMKVCVQTNLIDFYENLPPSCRPLDQSSQATSFPTNQSILPGDHSMYGYCWLVKVANRESKKVYQIIWLCNRSQMKSQTFCKVSFSISDNEAAVTETPLGQWSSIRTVSQWDTDYHNDMQISTSTVV